MSDDAKPKAGFLSGKKAPAPVKEAEPEQQRPVPIEIDPAEMAGFLKKPAAKPPESPVPAQAQPAPVQQTQAAQPKQAAPAARQAAPKAMAPAQAKARPAPAPVPVAGNRLLAEENLHKGLDHYDRQETEQALEAYQACVAADPGFALGHNNLGMVLIDLERYEEAISALYESIRCDPAYAEAYNNLGFVLRRMNRHVEAACAYTQFLAIEPEIEEGSRIQGWIDSVIRDNGLTALPPFTIPANAELPPEPEPEPPAAKAPEPSAKIKKMAAWEVAAGNVETAAPVSAIGEVGDPSELLRTASALPSTPRPNLAGMAPPAAQPPAAAAKPLAAAPQPGARPAARPAAPVNPIELIEKGMDAFGDGDLEGAVALFKQAIQANPENAEAHSGLGKALIRMENFEEGIEELKVAVQYDPNDPAPYYVLGFALRAIERNVEAADAYDAFLRLMPDALETSKMREWVIRIKGAPAPAAVEDTYVDDEQIVTETDKRYKVALTKFQEGDVDTTLRECVKILNEDPGHFRTRVLLGRIYLRQKSYDNAVEQLEGALVTRPDYPEALYFLGQAAEKRGALDAASASYKRYLEVLPQGPRAERLNEWLLQHAPGEVAATSQIQCELCLRFFPGGEMTQHEGKATCRNCLVVMGAAPSIEAHAPAAKSDKELARTEMPAAPGGSKKLLVAGLGFGAVAAAAAFLFMTHRLDPLLIRFKIIKPPPVKIVADTSTNTSVSAAVVVDTTNIKISGDPKLQVQPFALWTYTPGIDGVAELDAKAKGWTAEYILKDGPPGMEFKDKTLVWMPAPADFAALKAGATFPVSFAIKGVFKPTDGRLQELFSFSKSFTLTSQFGYELGPEQDMQIEPAEPVALTASDLNGDGQHDVVAASGQFRHGGLRLYTNRGDDQFGAPQVLASGARYSAVWSGPLEGDKTGMLAANWFSGDITAYFVDKNTPVAGTKINMGPGPVALSAAAMDDSKTMYVAALLGVGRRLSVAPLTPDRKFGDVIGIPLPASGGNGFLFPWTSADLGAGFIAVTPLADAPIQFVAFNKGAWNKSGGVIASGDDLGLIEAAVLVQNGPGKPARLALATSTGRNAQLVVLEEKNGKFSAVGQPISLQTQPLGLLACDFNLDGQDDLLLSTADECTIYFCDAAGNLHPGPAYKSSHLRGPAVVLLNKNPGARPGVLLLNDSGKAVTLKPVEPSK